MSAAAGRERPVKSNKKLMNIEHRTSNIEHRIMYSVYFKKWPSAAIPYFIIRNFLFDILRFAVKILRSFIRGLVPIYWNHIMFAHDICHIQVEYLINSIDFNRKDRATCRVVAEGEAWSDTTNIQSSIFNSGLSGLGFIIQSILYR